MRRNKTPLNIIGYKDNVNVYFDLECTTDKILTDYLVDEYANWIFDLVEKVDKIIKNCYESKESVNNCAMLIKKLLVDDEKGTSNV
jgi:hypothetical protein